MSRDTWRIWAATFLLGFGAGWVAKAPGWWDLIGYVALGCVPELIVSEVMERWRRALRHGRG